MPKGLLTGWGLPLGAYASGGILYLEESLGKDDGLAAGAVTNAAAGFRP